MDSSDYSHLYHDRHFCSQSGVLEAREHLKARDVNARDQRLLRQQDRHLQMAKDQCQRRHSWEQDSVRRHLQAILERTPTFERTLRNERWKMSTAKSTADHGWAVRSDMLRSFPNANNSPHKGVLAGLVSPSPRTTFPRLTRRRLSPIAVGKTESPYNKTDKTTPQLNRKKPADEEQNPSVGFSGMSTSLTLLGGHDGRTGDELPSVESSEGRSQAKAPPASLRQSTVGQATLTTPNPGRPTEPAEPSSPLSGSSLGAVDDDRDVIQCRGTRLCRDRSLSDSSTHGQQVDAVSRSQRKGAHLRRRSHHAVMAIVRVQARHEQRKC